MGDQDWIYELCESIEGDCGEDHWERHDHEGRWHRHHRHHHHGSPSLVLTPGNPEDNQGESVPTFTMADNQHVAIALAATNPDGSAATIDAGSVTATMADGTEATAVAGTDASGNPEVTVTAEGAVTADDLLTVTCTINGGAETLTATLDFALTGVAELTLTPGTPVNN